MEYLEWENGLVEWENTKGGGSMKKPCCVLGELDKVIRI